MKAFISHSHHQSSFAVELVELLGRDNCILDKYDFEPALKTLEEVYRGIDQSSIFVLLLSKEALYDSKWVQIEIEHARHNYNVKQLDLFLPYIIDEIIGIEDIPDWMSRDECFNLRRMQSPKMLAKDIEEKKRRLVWRNKPMIKARETAFVGRNEDIDAFQNIIYSEAAKKIRGLIVSGRAGVGKDFFTRHCLLQVGKQPEYEPYRISLTSKDSIELFIVELNTICRKYNDSETKAILSGSIKDKADAAVALLNDLYDRGEVIFIEDDMSCVNPSRHLSEWLTDITTHPSLASHLGLFVLSRVSPITYLRVSNPEVAHIQLYPLDAQDRRKLFYKYAQSYGLDEISKEDVDFFINKLVYSPNQLLFAVDAIKNNGLKRAKQDVQALVSLGDQTVRPVLERFKEGEGRNCLVILARFEFVSFDLLKELFADTYDEVEAAIGDMLVYGIVDVFGPGQEYIRLDHYISDYITRNKLSLPSDLELLLSDVLENRLVKSSEITEDVSLYLYNVRQSILKGKGNANDFLIPSVAVKAIIDLYNKSDWHGVIRVCDKVLVDQHNYYPDVAREIIYWQCLAFCRTKNEKRFFENVDKIDGADNAFLRGFFFRNKQLFYDAEKKYREALSREPKMQRAKRELVSVLLAQRKYPEALDLSRENYESNKDNTYHICAYFRCLIQKHPLTRDDIEILDQLIVEVEESYSQKKESLVAAMRLEYEWLVRHAGPDAMLKRITEFEKRFPESFDVKRVAEEYRYKQSLITKRTILDEDFGD